MELCTEGFYYMYKNENLKKILSTKKQKRAPNNLQLFNQCLMSMYFEYFVSGTGEIMLS